MAVGSTIKHLFDGAIKLSDGTGTPVTLILPFTVGDLSISGLQETLRNVVAYEARGVLTGVRHTSIAPPTGSFSLQLAELTDAAVGVALDFVRKTAGYSSNVSTLGASAECYTVDVELAVEGSDHGDTDRTITLTDCHVLADFAEGEPNTLSCNFTCYGTVTAA